MPRTIVNLAVTRKASTRTTTGGFTQSDGPITGSPFQCRVFRKPSTTIDRDEAVPAIATIDNMIVVSFINPAAAVLVNDLVTLPEGTTAKIIRIRRYQRTLQCDAEIGVE